MCCIPVKYVGDLHKDTCAIPRVSQEGEQYFSCQTICCDTATQL